MALREADSQKAASDLVSRVYAPSTRIQGGTLGADAQTLTTLQ